MFQDISTNDECTHKLASSYKTSFNKNPWKLLNTTLELIAGQARVSPSHFLLLVSNNPVSPLIAPGRSSRLVIGPPNQGEPDAALIGGLLLRFDRKHQKGADTSWCSDIWVRLH